MSVKKTTLRLTESEHQLLCEKVRKSGLSQQQYLKKCALGKRIIVMEGFKDIAFELKKIGINLNQLTRCANEGGYIDNQELQHLSGEVTEVWQLLKQCGRMVGAKK